MCPVEHGQGSAGMMFRYINKVGRLHLNLHVICLVSCLSHQFAHVQQEMCYEGYDTRQVRQYSINRSESAS